jgi:hypothetical protein
MNQKLSDLINVTTLRKKIDSIMFLPIDPVECNAAGEEITTIYESDWIKIFIIRNSDFSGEILVEVELSLPSKWNYTEVVLDMIQHLTYIQELLNQGFELCVIKEECLWVASRSFSKVPDDSILEALLHLRTQSSRGDKK